VITLRRLYANRWIRYALTLLLLAAVAYKIHPSRLFQAAASVQVPDLVLAALLTVPFLALKAWRWYLILRESGINADFKQGLVSLVGGMGLALITPARLGELVRVAYIPDGRKWKIGGLVMIDKAFDVLVLTGLSIAGAWSLLGAWVGLACTALTLIGLFVVFRPASLAPLLYRFSSVMPGRSKLERIWESLDALKPRSATIFIAVTLLAFGVVLLQFGIILSSWHAASISIVALTFPIVILTNVVPVTIGGLGLREAAAALLLAHYGVSSADAALAAFLMFAINTALPGMIGAFFLPAGRATSQRPIVMTPDRS
jgi:uncharacterized protein (TIRG00374 family)